MKQRVGIARALANRPSTLLMDEPFGALDALTRDSMRTELLRIWLQLQPTMVFVTHSVQEAVYVADHVAIMKLGEGSIHRKITIELPHLRIGGDSSWIRWVALVVLFGLWQAVSVYNQAHAVGGSFWALGRGWPQSCQ